MIWEFRRNSKCDVYTPYCEISLQIKISAADAPHVTIHCFSLDIASCLWKVIYYLVHAGFSDVPCHDCYNNLIRFNRFRFNVSIILNSGPRGVPALISSDSCWNATSECLHGIIQVPRCRVVRGSS